MERKAIDLNEVEQVLLGEELRTVRAGIEAQARIQKLAAGIVQRAGQTGHYNLSNDLKQLIPFEPEENDDGSR